MPVSRRIRESREMLSQERRIYNTDMKAGVHMRARIRRFNDCLVQKLPNFQIVLKNIDTIYK